MLKYSKNIFLILSLLLLDACTQLNEKDRKLLLESRAMAEEARETAIISAYNAEIASEKANRIFKQSQKK